MNSIEAIALRHNLVLIEDAAQAHAAERGGKRAGGFGTGCFSFYATKNMMAGEGGMLTTNDSGLASRLRRLRSHGEAERYSSIEVGFNYRITDLQAAIALAQLHRLTELTAARRRNAAFLSANLRGVQLPPEPDVPESMVWHQYTIRVPDGGRDNLQQWLQQRDIQALVFYPNALPSQPLYRNLGYNDDALPVARRLAQEVLSLPVHPGLSESDLDQIVTAVNTWAESRQPLSVHD
jgi:dTDP-4-amino-4,6-dideoxygalactose transaminase